MSHNIPSAHNVKVKRVYEKPARGDGVRVLIDRLWPHGVKKADARWINGRRTLRPVLR